MQLPEFAIFCDVGRDAACTEDEYGGREDAYGGSEEGREGAINIDSGYPLAQSLQ
jgi:hypothetical protein